jgi:pimeloyl-ACP methyl ester carboxylesterase
MASRRRPGGSPGIHARVGQGADRRHASLRSETAVFGVSAGGELALALGLRHPDVYGAIFCASSGGGYRPPGVMPGPVPRAYLVAGTLEPFFLRNAAWWADALRDAGADVVMKQRPGSHGDVVSWSRGGCAFGVAARPGGQEPGGCSAVPTAPT